MSAIFTALGSGGGAETTMTRVGAVECFDKLFSLKL
jgi:hypothetical protein